MTLRDDLLSALLTLGARPLRGRPRVRRLGRQVQLHVRKVLQQTDEEE